ncbi:MAG: hypothetical protein QOG87_3419 [Actinomycetota bacterium]|jgi:hypothetical protein
MVPLVPAQGTFHAKVIAARLGAEGIATQLRGSVDGPYPCFGEVTVYVATEDLEVAAEILLVDEVEATLDPVMHATDDEPATYTRLTGWLPLASMAVATCTVAVRAFA